MHCIIQAGYLEAVMLRGDNKGFQTQGGLLQFLSQSSQLPLLLLAASLQPLNLSDKRIKYYNTIVQTQKRRRSFSRQLTSSFCSSFSLSSACLSLSFCWASSFSLCRLSCCSCCSLRGATRRGDPGGADPRTAAAGHCPDWTVGREKKTNIEN